MIRYRVKWMCWLGVADCSSDRGDCSKDTRCDTLTDEEQLRHGERSIWAPTVDSQLSPSALGSRLVHKND
jgi:hypothetical protein